MKRKEDFWGVLGGNKGEGKATRSVRGDDYSGGRPVARVNGICSSVARVNGICSSVAIVY